MSEDAPPNDLAALVEKPSAEAAIDSLQAEGVYDADRKVTEHDDGTVALPVTGPPQETNVLDVMRQTDPELRAPELNDLLADRGWTDEELALAPSSWAVIGSVLTVRLNGDCPREEEVGEALLELHGEADTVLADGGVSGIHREPTGRVIAGIGETETIHTEHGTRYALDLAEVMFSPGNKAERARMGSVVAGNDGPEPETDNDGPERVFDMFAGIGYFTLPMARAGAQVTAAEINPTAYRFLIENAVLNDVTANVEAYRADCRDVDVSDVDRVVMGYYGVETEDEDGSRSLEAHEFLDTAFDAVAPGGIVHVHAATPDSRLWDRPIGRIEDAAGRAGRDVKIVEKRRVKSHSEGVWHVVCDVRVR
ncbi:class I SAM-dependent methyltransferase [Natranaeroarchaeum aerophilus]|uniref:Class I SAM-dependent methyltransferase family protein n=1 Tax=Natranaeroarchaeum aerophilus TaxID=2917711 RepID=A0AAE3K768_9EURY|nr:class I SAM-dependent methyltransferase family protein [Natranaeroarchaeum aerophilus]MCL9813569.1 class I SAM-dependent methyltransferase family protein [Natranaeroarchaeum aerophilus]